MPVLSAFFAAIILILRASALAAESKPAAGEVPPQSRCFCIQYTGGISPYYLGRLPVPECAGLKYKDNGNGPLATGLLECKELTGCLNAASPEYAEKRKILETKTVQAKERLAACCAASKGEKRPGAPCVNKCSADWDGILKVLAGETEKLDKAERLAREQCVARGAKAKKKSGRKPAGGPELGRHGPI